MTVRATTRAALFPGRQAGSLFTRQGPLAGRYPAVAAMVIFALVPYLILSAALQPLAPIIARDLQMSLQTVNLTNGLGSSRRPMITTRGSWCSARTGAPASRACLSAASPKLSPPTRDGPC